MAYMSNQWLNRGYGLRNRSYSPVRVKVSAKKPKDSWSHFNKIDVEVVATRDNGQYQTLHLSAAEVVNVVDIVVGASSEAMRRRLVSELLRGMNDQELLSILNDDLKKRVGKTRRSGRASIGRRHR